MPKEKLWITLLTMLVLLHQTMSTSNTEEVFRAVGRSVTFRIQDTSGRDAAVWYFGNESIVTASFEDPPQAVFSNQTFKTRFAVSEKGRALSISQLMLEDSGTYSVTIGKKTSTFILRVYRELAEPTVTCEAQSCSSGGSCRFSLRCSVSGTDFGNIFYSWRMGHRLWDKGPVLLWVNKSSLEEPLTCTARNPVSSRNVTISTPGELCTSSLSDSGIMIGVIAGVVVTILLLLFCKFRLSTTNTEEVFGVVGRSITFLIQDTSGGDEAVWSFGNEHIVTASFEDPPQAVFSKQTLKKRFAVSEKGHALSISQLRLEDAGTYSVTIGKKTSTFILHVYRELAEPTLTCEAKSCSIDRSCRLFLRCSVTSTDLGKVSYTWRMGDRLWGEGPVLLWVDKSDLEGLGPLTCTARNPVSNRSVTIRTPDLLCTVSTSDTEKVFGIIGRSVTFHTHDTSGGDGAVWSFEDRHIVTVSFEDPPQAVFSKQTFKTRFAVSEKGRALSISQLTLEDAGTYSVKINEKTFTFILHVYSEIRSQIPNRARVPLALQTDDGTAENDTVTSL
ncbi:hypothetical protein TURU_002387 [Turdus rufiventris]|nr:hypothetical protein TURU_002387 [Turdus rufiventris]